MVVCLDVNEHIYKKLIRKALTDIKGLAMKEVVGEFTGTPIGSTLPRLQANQRRMGDLRHLGKQCGYHAGGLWDW